MALANEVMLSIKARDQASRQTRAIHRDLTKVQQVGKQTNVNFKRMFDEMQRGSKKSNEAMMGLARTMRGMLGVGSAAAGVALVVQGFEEGATAAGDLELAFQTLGEQAKQSLDELDVLGLSKEWAVSIADVRVAWAGLSTGVRDAGRVTSREVEVVLALMQKAGIGAEQASAAVASAMNGDMDALANALGIPVDLLGSQEQAFDRVLASGEKAIGPLEKIVRSVKDVFDPAWHAEMIKDWDDVFINLFSSDSKPATEVKRFVTEYELEMAKIEVASGKAAAIAAGYFSEITLDAAAAGLAITNAERAASDAEAIRNAGSGRGDAGATGSTDAEQGARDAAADAAAAAILAAEAAARREAEREAAAAEIARRQGAVTPDPFAGPGAEHGQGDPYWRYMAEGGVVTRATRAVIGEKGPEAVIPLDKMGGMGGFSQTIVLNNPQFNDEFGRRQVTRQINRLTREEFRRHGGAIA